MILPDSQIIITVENNQTSIQRFVKDPETSEWVSSDRLNFKQTGKVQGGKVQGVDTPLPSPPDFGDLRRIMNIAFRNELRQQKGVK